MTREEIEMRTLVRESDVIDRTDASELAKAFNTLWEKYIEQEPCEDAISRNQVKSDYADWFGYGYEYNWFYRHLSNIPPVNPQPKTGRCKDCKWWKDSDGIYRRGGHAESQCPINRKEVLEGNGYCYMFEPQESEDKHTSGKGLHDE